MGFTSYAQLRDALAAKRLSLPRNQVIGVKYYEDLQLRIPRSEVQEMEQFVRDVAVKVWPGISVEAVGSYRRGKSSSGDIDLLLKHQDGKLRPLRPLTQKLHRVGFMLEDLTTFASAAAFGSRDQAGRYLTASDAPGSTKCETFMGIGRLPYVPWCVRRLFFMAWVQHYRDGRGTIHDAPYRAARISCLCGRGTEEHHAAVKAAPITSLANLPMSAVRHVLSYVPLVARRVVSREGARMKETATTIAGVVLTSPPPLASMFAFAAGYQSVRRRVLRVCATVLHGLSVLQSKHAPVGATERLHAVGSGFERCHPAARRKNPRWAIIRVPHGGRRVCKCAVGLVV